MSGFERCDATINLDTADGRTRMPARCILSVGHDRDHDVVIQRSSDGYEPEIEPRPATPHVARIEWSN